MMHYCYVFVVDTKQYVSRCGLPSLYCG